MDLRAVPAKIEWHSGLPIFASEPFLKTVADEYGWIGGINNSGQLRCILPYTVIRKVGCRIIRFRVETIPLDCDFDIREETSFLKSAVEYLRSKDADMIIPAANTALFRTYPEGALAAPYGTFTKDLTLTEEVLWNEVSQAFRKDIRRAIKSGVQISEGIEYLETAYNLTADTLRRSGQRFKSYGVFKNLILALGGNVKVFVAKQQGVAQACLVAPFSRYSAHTWYGGTVEEPCKGAMHLLHWEAIRQFRSIGVERFNFTGVRTEPEKGSKQEGILTFKMRFGGKFVQGYAWKYSLHPLKFAAYSIGMRLLKGGDIVDLERHKLASRLAAHAA